MREKKTLVLDQLPQLYNEGLFWGNGCIGSMVYVKGNTVCFVVDHVKLWETRESTEDVPKGTFQDFINNPESYFSGKYYIADKRLELAAKLLTDTDDTIVEIVEKIGYSDAASFTRKFTKHFMVPPGKYRMQMKERDNASKDNM